MSAPLALVVPCFEEERRLAVPALEDALDLHPDLRLVLVDDGSRDGTLGILRALAARRPGRVEVVALPENRGKGEAVRAGLLAALARVPAPAFVGWFDADLATPLEVAFDMRAVLEREPAAAMVLGSRRPTPGSEIRRRVVRHLPGRFLARRIARTIDLDLHDTQCGAKVLRAAPWLPPLLAEPFLTRWLFDVEVLLRLAREHRRGALPPLGTLVREHPLPRWTDVPGSKVRAADFARALLALRRLRRAYGGP